MGKISVGIVVVTITIGTVLVVDSGIVVEVGMLVLDSGIVVSSPTVVVVG
jgi:hypothetical protein